MKTKRPGPGAMIEIGYPFVLIEREGKENPNPESDQWKWRPGVRSVPVYPDSSDDFADGMGTLVVTIVSTHTPPGWPERVFFTKTWRTPEGFEFGRRKLHTLPRPAFTTLCRGFRHRFELTDDAIRIASPAPALEHAP